MAISKQVRAGIVEAAVGKLFGKKIHSMKQELADAADAIFVARFSDFAERTAGLPAEWFPVVSRLTFDHARVPDFHGIAYSEVGCSFKSTRTVALSHPRAAPASAGGAGTLYLRDGVPAAVVERAEGLADEIRDFAGKIGALAASVPNVKALHAKFPEFSEFWPPLDRAPLIGQLVPASLLSELADTIQRNKETAACA